MISKRKIRFYTLSFLKRDFKASITVFFVALPLCLGISIASGAPLESGIIAGIVGGIVVTLFSGSELSVSGPAAGVTAICLSAIHDLGALELFFMAVTLAGVIQLLIGALKLGGFTHFIPSAVIKGMLAAIGILLIFKQLPLIIGYDKADFWSKELINVFTFHHVFSNIQHLTIQLSLGAILISFIAVLVLFVWKRYISKHIPSVPVSIVIVITGTLLAWVFGNYFPSLALLPGHFVHLPDTIYTAIHIPDVRLLFKNTDIIRYAVAISFVTSLETLLSLEAIDKLDPYNRISPPNKELVAQGIGNITSGLLAGLPITAVIVRSSANAEAGARTKLSAWFHGIWLLLFVTAATVLVNKIPYCVLAIILIRTGYNLAKPKMIHSVYKQGSEQFLPFVVTIIAILFTDLLIGVCIGVVFSAYFILMNTYKAGYALTIRPDGHTSRYNFQLAINVSYINKKKLKDELEKIPHYSIVDIDGSKSVYIDYDVLEVINEFKAKAKHRHIELNLMGVPEVETIELH